MIDSLKRQTIYGKDLYLFRFYWASWSPNVCIVKEHNLTGSVSWQTVHSISLARKLWGSLAREAASLGEKEVISYQDSTGWDSERIQWVRKMLAE